MSVFGKVERKLEVFSSYSWTIPIFSLLFSTFPLIGTFFPVYQILFARIFFIGSGLTSLCFSLLAKVSDRAFTLELFSHARNIELGNGDASEIKLVAKKMERLSSVAGTGGILLGILTMSFGCSEYMLRKVTYFILSGFVELPMIIVLILFSFASKTKGNTVGKHQFAKHKIKNRITPDDINNKSQESNFITMRSRPSKNDLLKALFIPTKVKVQPINSECKEQDI